MPDMTNLIRYLLWFGAIGCGLLAGVYFAFSTFIMTAFGRIEPAKGVSAMSSINSTIVRSLFMPFFYGTTIVSVVLVIVALSCRSKNRCAAFTYYAGSISVFSRISRRQFGHFAGCCMGPITSLG